jgi:hypothetical protein
MLKSYRFNFTATCNGHVDITARNEDEAWELFEDYEIDSHDIDDGYEVFRRDVDVEENYPDEE